MLSDKIKGMPKNVPTFVELALDMPQGTFFMVFVNPHIRPEDLSFVQKTLLDIFKGEYNDWMESLMVSKPSGDKEITNKIYNDRIGYYQKLSKDPRYAVVREKE